MCIESIFANELERLLYNSTRSLKKRSDTNVNFMPTLVSACYSSQSMVTVLTMTGCVRKKQQQMLAVLLQLLQRQSKKQSVISLPEDAIIAYIPMRYVIIHSLSNT